MLKNIAQRNGMILMGIGLSVFFWLLEAAIHYFVFHQGPYLTQIFHPNVHETWMRLIIVFLLIAFGAYAQTAINRRKEAEEKAKLSYMELEQIFNTAADGMRVIDTNLNVLRAKSG